MTSFEETYNAVESLITLLASNFITHLKCSTIDASTPTQLGFLSGIFTGAGTHALGQSTYDNFPSSGHVAIVMIGIMLVKKRDIRAKHISLYYAFAFSLYNATLVAAEYASINFSP